MQWNWDDGSKALPNAHRVDVVPFVIQNGSCQPASELDGAVSVSELLEVVVCGLGSDGSEEVGRGDRRSDGG